MRHVAKITAQEETTQNVPLTSLCLATNKTPTNQMCTVSSLAEVINLSMGGDDGLMNTNWQLTSWRDEKDT